MSKAWLDVAGRPDPAPGRVANDPDGLAALVRQLRELAPARIVLEATGGLELAVVGALQVAGLPVAVVNPRRVRDFATATGQLAKTDRLDAALLAHFAEAIRPAPASAVPDDVRHLDALLTRRNPLIQMRVMETNRLDRLADAVLRKEVRKHVAWRTKAIDRADAAVAGAVKSSPVWRAKDALLRASRGSARSPPSPSSPAFRNSAPPPAVGSPHGSAWPRSRTTADPDRAGGTSAAAEPRSAGRWTWPPCRRWFTTRRCGRSRRGWPPAGSGPR